MSGLHSRSCEDGIMMNIDDRLTSVTRWAVTGGLALVLAAPAVAAAQTRYSGVVVFGTSLSDPGNAFVLVGDQNTPADFDLNPFLIPSAPYAQGGHHFSNGATWIEQFARGSGLGGSAKAALGSSSTEASNYAVGAARAWEDGVNFNLTRQVSTFLGRSGPPVSPTALYVIEMGGNDVRDAFQMYIFGGPTGPARAGEILTAALGSIAANIQRLYRAGARDFLVWSAPNIALTPAIRSLGPQAGGLATGLAQTFNANLNTVIAGLSALPGTTFARLEAFEIQAAIVAHPENYGLTNATTACIRPSVAPFSCQNADEYLFWDGIHPTRAGHAILAQETANVVR
jgi:phospholipase/lecithinase/hemolysin